ncbi:hypothetical protein PENSTE_c012G10266 [Penicillium steckii]|uniref:Uncharacterized protein n=1 Tax=Penicillium steckii TaxID=303698 RepID=A0A1V6T3Y6_9EURO|nr:hypothetical protein PENSTE_c012G10266 [Penicillium steckii]
MSRFESFKSLLSNLFQRSALTRHREMDNKECSLREACSDPNRLFALPEEDLLRLVYKEFSEDIDRLTRAYSIREDWNPPDCPSPSFILYQKNYDEVNRTLVGLLALRWIYLGEYETFVASQPPTLQITRQSFEWLQEIYRRNAADEDTLYVVIMSIVINDLGKDPQLAIDYKELTGDDISQVNHDSIISKACEVGLVKSLEKLSPSDREDVECSIHLGATLNFGQLGQGENVPVCLAGLLKLRGKPRSFEIRFMEQLLDIAGAAGHMDWTCAKTLIEPLFQSHESVYYACRAILSGELDARGGYDLILLRRAKFLQREGYRLLDVKNSPNDRALIRLFCMARVTDLEKAKWFEDTWKGIEDTIREGLIRDLNIDGSSGQPAIQPTYMPAFLSRIHDEKALTCALNYLSRIVSAVDDHDRSAVVIERSVLEVMKKYVETGIFDQDPQILERIDIPEAVIAQRESD